MGSPNPSMKNEDDKMVRKILTLWFGFGEFENWRQFRVLVSGFENFEEI